MKIKFKKHKGETLVEFLAAMIISVMFMVIVAEAMSQGASSMGKVKDSDDLRYIAELWLEHLPPELSSIPANASGLINLVAEQMTDVYATFELENFSTDGQSITFNLIVTSGDKSSADEDSHSVKISNITRFFNVNSGS